MKNNRALPRIGGGWYWDYEFLDASLLTIDGDIPRIEATHLTSWVATQCDMPDYPWREHRAHWFPLPPLLWGY